MPVGQEVEVNAAACGFEEVDPEAEVVELGVRQCDDALFGGVVFGCAEAAKEMPSLRDEVAAVVEAADQGFEGFVGYLGGVVDHVLDGRYPSFHLVSGEAEEHSSGVNDPSQDGLHFGGGGFGADF